jgi:hypothetical protein
MDVERMCDAWIVNNWNKDSKKNVWTYKRKERYMQNLKNDELNNLIKDKNIINCIKAQRMSSFGHVYQIINDRMVKELCEWIQIF